jgi:hypothetical protein
MALNLSSISNFVLDSKLKALATVFILAFIPLLGSIAIVLTALVTLRKGPLIGLMVTIGATMPYLILLPFQSMPLGLWITLIVVLTNLLTWLFAVVKRSFNAWGPVLEIAAFIGMTVVIMFHLLIPDISAFWQKKLTVYLTQIVGSSKNGLSGDNAITNLMQQLAKSDVDNNKAVDTAGKSATAAGRAVSSKAAKPLSPLLEPEVISFINQIKFFVSGIIAVALIFSALLQVGLAQLWQASISKNTGPPLAMFHNIRFSAMMGLVFIVVIVLSYLKIAVAIDMLSLLYMAFFISGLSLVHYLCSNIKGLAWLGLFVFYSILICSWTVYHLPLLFQLLALVALLDVWLDWRQKLRKMFS